MLKTLITNVKNIEKNIYKIMFFGFKISIVILIISGILSIMYILNPISHMIFESGIILFKTGLTFYITFFVCGFMMDKIKKQII